MKLFGNTGKNSKHLKTDDSAAAAARRKAASARSAAPPAGSTAKPAKRAAAKSVSTAARRRRRGRTAAIVSAILVLLIIGTVVGYAVWEKPPEVAVATPTPEVKHTESPVQTAAPKESDDEEVEEEDDFDGALLTDRNDGVYTFLLAGRDHESNSTDTIIVGKFDTVNHTIDAINIPRDTLINIGWSNAPKKINSAYPGYFYGGSDPVEGMLKHLRDFVGFDMDCYVIVNLEVVEQVIDAIGGVDFDVPMDMDYEDYVQNFEVHLKAGEQHLTGAEALGVFRFRSGYTRGDLQRIGVQQDLIKTIAAKMLSLGNIPNLTKIIQLLVENVETDLDASNMAFFARQFLKCKAAGVNFHTAPTGNTCMINGVSYVSTDLTKWIEMVNELVNPFTEDVTLSNVNILTSNASGTSVTSTTGSIAGGMGSFWCNVDGCPMKGSAHAPGAHSGGGGSQITDPGTVDPGITDPGTTDPGTTDPGTTDPGTTDPGTTDPGTTDPGTTDPGVPSEPSTPNTPSTPSEPSAPAPDPAPPSAGE